MFLRRVSGMVWLLGIMVSFTAQGQMQQQPLPPYQPARAEVLTAYKEAARLDSLARNSIYKNNVKANWQPDSKGFWYRNSLPDNTAEFFLVDARTGTKTKLLDTSRLAPCKEQWLRQRRHQKPLGTPAPFR